MHLPFPRRRRRLLNPTSEALGAVRRRPDSLAKVPEIFDRNDTCRALGYEPDRGSLYRTIRQMKQEGLPAAEQRGSGKLPTRYRKTGGNGGEAGG